ncbi:MAG: hypothetical protein H7318_14650 [Oligoflexus sp.]|nr:hypothetical protein [Oligoflexus sp.]
MYKSWQGLSLSLLTLSLSCSSQKGPRISIAPKAPLKLPSADYTGPQLSDLLPDEASQQSFDFTKPYEAVFSSEAKVVFAHGDGRSITYDAALKAWSSSVLSPRRGEYDVYYDFLDQGHVGLSASELTLRRQAGPTVLSDRPPELTNESPIGFNPGFAGVLDKTVLMTVRADGVAAKVYKSESFPAATKQVAPCNAACLLWALADNELRILEPDGTWRKIALPIALEPDVKRIALYFQPDAKTPVLKSMLTVANSGAIKIYVNVPLRALPTWEDVKLISERFCVSCHLDDGFENPETWSALKISLISRLKATAKADSPMPPPETLLGKEMSLADKTVLITWLGTIAATTRGSLGNVPGDFVDKAIDGELKVVGDKYCLSCHADANRLLFWKSKQGDIGTRVTSGSMPKNTMMPDADKKKLLDLVKAL